ncbi:NADH dehydrogenase [Rothia sp. HMSC064D08]|jgi:putative NADH dehydrogenase|uniref:NAD(P)/FAD-dependent oxidoreductase n=1 Tax=Rothia TaxID=32207 RepID=UPI0001E069E0|nr:MULTISPECIES: FAD-dependent oxidoreductase [Rothia]EFJ76723.1 pyridine nucleotide-disulfide oxidoreductase [Rothia dentocariosa M567]MCM3438121.1 FAD-dependent oxidoreductase [Rothia dentocariosa]OFN01987.1 NADH dehydrogenase [Rothia sp. HMSC064D08]OFP55716.1 NADH dehydrogenase [Rothia sp. HMSC069C01]PLA18307.1 NADH dehydrogenase FAD-containing subunit [Rothia dentocariosa]
MSFHKAQDRPRILIVGGGYVGFTVAKKIQKAIKQTGGVVTIVEPNPYMTYQPFLPEVAAGSMEGRNATVPLRQHLRDTELIPGHVVSVNHAERTATVEPIDNGEPFDLKYDEIILGAGAVTRAFPIPGLAEVAIGMKTVEEAVSVRNWVLERIEVASVLDDPDARRRALTVVVVGGGFAGVETISELEDMAREAVNRNDRLSVSDLRFVMIEAAPRIMPEVPEDRAEKVVAELRARGIEVLLNTSLSDATDGHLQLINMTDKSPAGEMDTDTLIWTAGVAASPMLKNTDFPIDERGRVRVNADLRVAGDNGVVEGAWAAGDNAAVPDLSGGGVGGFCVPNAQHASRQALVLAKNILASRRGEPLTDYYHETIGVVAGLGLWKGVANFKGKTFAGPLAWIMHRGYHGSAIPTTERTVRVMTTWALNQLFGRDTTTIRHQRSPRLAFQEATGTAPAKTKAKL